MGYQRLLDKARDRRKQHLRPGTHANRKHHKTAFKDWLHKEDISRSAVKPDHLLAFLESRLETGLKLATVSNYLYSLRAEYRHSDGLRQALNHHSVKEWLIGLEKTDTTDCAKQPYIRYKELKKLNTGLFFCS